MTKYGAHALTDPGYGTPGMTVQDDRGVPVASETLPRMAGNWDADAADEWLALRGFRRITGWEWLSPEWVADVEDTADARS